MSPWAHNLKVRKKVPVAFWGLPEGRLGLSSRRTPPAPSAPPSVLTWWSSVSFCRELMLVADALRLGGAILSQYPDMLAPQLIGRLLPEMEANPNVKSLLKQCDGEGIEHCGLLPSYHCAHTPGGPLKVCQGIWN